MTLALEALEPDVLAAQQGDAPAFARLVDATSKLVSSIAVAKLRDIDGSEDLTQEIYLAAWQGIHRLENPQSFLPWLKQLSRNQTHTAIRERQRVRSRITSGDENIIDAAVDAAPGPGLDMVTQEERRVVQECFEQLADDAREMVTLYYREGKSIRQVAALLELKEATVKKRLERARNSLRSSTLERFAEVARKTAPGAAFTTAILATLTVGASKASASTLGGVAATSKGAGLAGKAAAVGPVLLGLALGAFGVVVYFHGYGKLVARESQKELLLLAMWSGSTVILLCAGITIAAALTSPPVLLATWAVVATVHCWVYFVRLPRLHQRAAERWLRVVRFAIPAFGVLAGTATVLYAASLM